MGDSGPLPEVGTFFSCVDNLHTGGLLPVVYPRDFPATWSANVHSFGHRYQIYGTLLKELPKGHGDTVDDEHRLSPIDTWSVGEDHTSFRGHAGSMCHRS